MPPHFNRRKGHHHKKKSEIKHKSHHSSNKNKIIAICPICHKPLRDLFTAIAYKLNEKPAHFDCILKQIKKNEELLNNEKICYLGNGSFGIIAFRNPSSPIKFLIRKRIQYEEADANPGWRVNLPVKL